MKVINSLVYMALASSFLVGCAKDKNMQDYQSDQVQTQMEKIRAGS